MPASPNVASASASPASRIAARSPRGREKRQEDRERRGRSCRGRRPARRAVTRKASSGSVAAERRLDLPRPGEHERAARARSVRRSTARPAGRDLPGITNAKRPTTVDRVAAVNTTVVIQSGWSNHASESTAIARLPRALRSWPRPISTQPWRSTPAARRAPYEQASAAASADTTSSTPTVEGRAKPADEHEQRRERGEGQQTADRGSPARAPVDSGQGMTIGLVRRRSRARIIQASAE